MLENPPIDENSKVDFDKNISNMFWLLLILNSI